MSERVARRSLEYVVLAVDHILCNIGSYDQVRDLLGFSDSVKSLTAPLGYEDNL